MDFSGADGASARSLVRNYSSVIWTLTQATRTLNQSVNDRELFLKATVSYDFVVTAPGEVTAKMGEADDNAVLRWLQYLLVPTIVALGVAANFLALVVYVASRLRRLSCSVYLAALAVTDSGFLLCLLSRWAHGIWLTDWNVCPVNYYLTGVFSFLSMSYVLGYTAERYLATCWPLQRKTWCTKRRAICLVALCFVFSLIIFFPTLFMFERRILKNRRGLQCTAREDYETILKWTSVCSLCVFWIIPTFLTIFLNFRIIRQMSQHDKSIRVHSSSIKAGQKLGVNRYSSSSLGSLANLSERVSMASDNDQKSRRWMNSYSRPLSNNYHRRSSYKITRMLVISSSAFIVMGLPYEILKEYHYFSFNNWSLDDIIDQEHSMTYKVIVILVYHLYYLNYGVDFFIYNVAGKNFRCALNELIHDVGVKFVKTLTCRNNAKELPVRV